MANSAYIFASGFNKIFTLNLKTTVVISKLNQVYEHSSFIFFVGKAHYYFEHWRRRNPRSHSGHHPHLSWVWTSGTSPSSPSNPPIHNWGPQRLELGILTSLMAVSEAVKDTIEGCGGSSSSLQFLVISLGTGSPRVEAHKYTANKAKNWGLLQCLNPIMDAFSYASSGIR